MGAVGEGIAEAAVVGVAEVAPAGVAGAGVGGDEGEGASFGLALEDLEGGGVAGFYIGDGEVGDLRELRGRGAEGIEEFVDGGCGAFDLDGDAGGGVEDVAGEGEGVGERVDEGAKADSLNDAADEDVFADGRWGGRGRHGWGLG